MTTIQLDRIRPRELIVTVEGTAPLILHAWSQTSKDAMRRIKAGEKLAAKNREASDPEGEFNAARYMLGDRDAFPAAGMKSAIVGAARLFDGVAMTQLRRLISVPGIGPQQLLPITAAAPAMREDTVRVGGGAADLRYRPQYWPWALTFTIRFLSDKISDDSVISLVDAGGLGGLGEWRPDKSATGSYGTFAVAAVDEVRYEESA